MSDHLSIADRSAIGEEPCIIVPAVASPLLPPGSQAVIVGIDEEGTLPPIDIDRFDVLLTTHNDPPAPWVPVPKSWMTAQSARLQSAVQARPIVATVLCQLLRINERTSFIDALTTESLAYSTLLGGAEFRAWLTARPATEHTPAGSGQIAITREGNAIMLTMDEAANGNAISATMRDALYTALANTLDDPTEPLVCLSANGRCFSTGGLLAEFGSATDLAQAHVVRTTHNVARLFYLLGSRGTVELHGACIGSGIEIAAAAARRRARRNSWFQLPELGMGLVPGAGGTVTIPRAIGRHRTAWLVLTGRRITAGRALNWGLVHEIVG